jgi:hypothetical protein
MKYLKTFENYSINEEEEIIGALKQAAGFFGKFNDDTKARAEKAIQEFAGKYPESFHVKFFNQLKEAYDSNSETTLEKADRNPFRFEQTELSVEDVKNLFEEVCCIIRMNDPNSFGIKQNKEGKLEAYQSTSYSSGGFQGHTFGSGSGS